MNASHVKLSTGLRLYVKEVRNYRPVENDTQRYIVITTTRGKETVHCPNKSDLNSNLSILDAIFCVGIENE